MWTLLLLVGCSAGSDSVGDSVAASKSPGLNLAEGVDPGVPSLAWAGGELLTLVRASWAEDARIGALSCLLDGSTGLMPGEAQVCLESLEDTCWCWGFFVAESRPGEQATCTGIVCGSDANRNYVGPGLEEWYVDSPAVVGALSSPTGALAVTLATASYFRGFGVGEPYAGDVPNSAADDHGFVMVNADPGGGLVDGVSGGPSGVD